LSGLNSQDGKSGCRSLKTLEVQSPADDVVYWSIDPSSGIIQGPLDLEFMRGKVLHLTLAPQQVALHYQDGKLGTVFMEGVHVLRVGHCAGDLPPDSELVFLAADHPLAFQWNQGRWIWITAGEGRKRKLPIKGRCTCHINGPDPFYATFLSHTAGTGESFTLRVIETLVLSQIEKSVDQVCGERAMQDSELESILTQLLPEDINPALAQCGLLCSDLVLQPASVNKKSAPETTGQSEAVGLNRGPMSHD
jgi:hypothetical protein